MIEIAGAPKELVTPSAEVASAPVADRAERRALLAVLRAEWSSLALVGADAREAAAQVAAALGEMARTYRLRPVRALDGAGASPPQLAVLQEELATARDGPARLVVMLDDPRAAPAGVPLLLQAEAALVVVRLGSSEVRSVEEIVALVGRERVLGCVVAR